MFFGSTLQVGGYVGNFEASVGAGICKIADDSGAQISGFTTGIDAEILLHLGQGPWTLALSGRLFVLDWDRSYWLTDNALGYGGVGFRVRL